MVITDFESWATSKGITLEAVKVIQNVRNSEPARKVNGGKKNVPGFYPSKKMGVTIQFESHKLELAGIYEKEHDKNVLEYYDQPPSFAINYIDKNGKKRGYRYTADFFVIEENWVGWEEWKHEEELQRLSIKYPTRFTRDTNGNWICPPAEEYAKNLGLSFRVVSSKDIDWSYQRNIQFLEDYLLGEVKYTSTKVSEQIIKYVTDEGFVNLDILLEVFDPDDIYSCIAEEKLYLDLYKSLIVNFKDLPVYVNKESADAYYRLKNSQQELFMKPETVKVQVNQQLHWDSQIYRVINIGVDNISLLSMMSEGIVEIPIIAFEALISNGKIKNVAIDKLECNELQHLEIIREASPKELEAANKKHDIVQMVMNGALLSDIDVPERTIRDWKSKYIAAEKKFGNGYVGLIPKRHKQGNRRRRLTEDTIDLMSKVIESEYENKKQKNKMRVYDYFVGECLKEGYSAPSYKTFCEEIKQRSIHSLTKKRQGPKASYDTERVYYELSMTTPRHGDMPFQVCHIDHTQLDVELVCSQTKKNLGRPWVTFLVDAFSRRILALYLTFDEPSYRSCMMVLRECVKRYSRFPKTIIVDGGKEFHSVYFDTLLARYSCIKKVRPGGKPKFGSVCERLFGTVNKDFIHNILGNTQLMKEVRKVTKEFNPKNSAVWTLEMLHHMIKKWAYEIYDNRVHSTLDDSPHNTYIYRIAKSGERKQNYIAYDQTFIMLSLPTTKKGTAKVIPGQGVKINRFYYWSDSFLNPLIEGAQVPVRYDPYNMGIAYAYVNNYWVELVSQNHHELANRTEKELKLIMEETRKRKRLTNSKKVNGNKDIVDFLRGAEDFEALQIQNLKDQALKNCDIIQENIVDISKESIEYSAYNGSEKKILDKGKNTIDEMITENSYEIYEEF